MPTNHPIADEEMQSLLSFACELADSAALITLPYFRQPLSVTNKLTGNDFDPVTIADRDAEKSMRGLIQTRYPDHGILGEEHGYTRGREALTWVLDPIDGTRAFISGLPTWGTLIALYDGVQPVVGVMDQPFTGERYSAVQLSHTTRVSTLQHRGVTTSLQTSVCDQLSGAIMMSTAPDMFNAAELKVQQSLVSKVKLMRYGGDCYAYCLLAAGQIDLVVESDLSTYDIQALIPIIENAGGIVTDWQGNSAINGGQVLAAATHALHQQALELLQPAAKKSASIL